MRSTANNFNFNKPSPIKIRPKFIWAIAVFIFTLCANIAAGSWVASAYKADYDNRLKAVENNVRNLSEVPARLSSIEGKMDVILNNVLRK